MKKARSKTTPGRITKQCKITKTPGAEKDSKEREKEKVREVTR